MIATCGNDIFGIVQMPLADHDARRIRHDIEPAEHARLKHIDGNVAGNLSSGDGFQIAHRCRKRIDKGKFVFQKMPHSHQADLRIMTDPLGVILERLGQIREIPVDKRHRLA